MTMSADASTAPLVSRPDLSNSLWYGSALLSFLATGEQTGGQYAMVRFALTRGFSPPAPHRHGPEDFYILNGRVRFWVGAEQVVAAAGDLVRTPPGIWHTFQVESDEAEFLLLFSPAGMESFFTAMGRPAEAMELPGGRVGPPDPVRLRALAPQYGIELAPPETTVEQMDRLP